MTGAMIALYPPSSIANSAALHEPDAETADDLHVTLAFLGEASDLTVGQVEAIKNVLAGIAAIQPPITAKIAGVGRFTAPGGEPEAFYASIDAPDLPATRERIVAALDRAGVPINLEHGFTPHMTLMYLQPGVPPPPSVDLPTASFDFDTIWYCQGDELIPFHLTSASRSFQGRLARIPKSSLLDSPILYGVASDAKPDMYRTRMSTSLFRSFIRRAQEIRPPFFSIAHYRYPLGEAYDLKVDGLYYKFRIRLSDDPLIDEFKFNLRDEQFRADLAFSIGFKDLDYYLDARADNLQVFTDGFNDHIAATTIPANPRSRLLSVEMRKTQFSDAERLVGLEAALFLEEHSRQ